MKQRKLTKPTKMRFEIRRTRVALAALLATDAGRGILVDWPWDDADFSSHWVWTPLGTVGWAVPFQDDGWVCRDVDGVPTRESIASCGEKPFVPLRRVLADGSLDPQVLGLCVYRCGRDAALLAAVPAAMRDVEDRPCDIHGAACVS